MTLEYPHARAFVVRMLRLDPNYGGQAHQREFVRRMHRMQELQPCPKEHEHEAACYSRDTIAKAAR